MKPLRIYLSIIFLVSLANSQDKPINYYDLVRFEVVDTVGNNYYKIATIYYNPSLGNALYNLDSNSSVNDSYVLKTKIKKDSKEIFLIDFGMYDSHDPYFSIYQIINGNKLELNWISAEVIRVPGDGYIYFNGRKNDYFDRSSKYTFDGNKFIEVVQPFYHVGVKSRVTKIMSLYYDEQLTKPIAVLPKIQNYSIVE